MVVLILLGGIVVLTGLLFLVYHLTVNAFSGLLERRERELQFVLHTGRIPPTWIRRTPKSDLGKRWVRRRALRRLRRLRNYYKHTPLVPGESERQTLMKRLEEIRRDWRASRLDEITLP